MRYITEAEYKKIKRLQNKFYDGVDRYCERLDTTEHFRDPFEEIMDIIDGARRNEQYENNCRLFDEQTSL